MVQHGGYSFDPLVVAEGKKEKTEKVTLDSVIQAEAQKAVGFGTVLGTVSAISAIEPDTEDTLLDVVLDHIGYEISDEDEVTYDQEAFDYTLGVTMDFLGEIGMSETAREDLITSDAVIASTALQEATSYLNDVTEDGLDLPTLIATVQNQGMIADAMGDDGVTMDSILGADLSGVTMDWSFSKTKSKLGNGTNEGGHKMKTVECLRTIDGAEKRGFCRYPKSLLSGKNYKKSKKKMTSAQRLAFANMTLAGMTSKANERRSKTMKHKNKSASKDKKAS